MDTTADSFPVSLRQQDQSVHPATVFDHSTIRELARSVTELLAGEAGEDELVELLAEAEASDV